MRFAALQKIVTKKLGSRKKESNKNDYVIRKNVVEEHGIAIKTTGTNQHNLCLNFLPCEMVVSIASAAIIIIRREGTIK